MRAIIALGLFLLPAWSSAQQPDPGIDPPKAPKAVAAARSRSFLPDPYPLERAWRTGDLGALVDIFELETAGRLRGQARLEHYRVLLALLQRVGDSTYSAALAQLWPQSHQLILQALTETSGPDSLSLPATYPLSFGPRRPAEPPVAACAATLAAASAGDTLSRLVTRIVRLPGGDPIPLPADAPQRVEVRFWVGATGTPLLSRVKLSYDADTATRMAARDAVSGWRFTPAEAAGCGIPNLYEERLGR